MWIAVFISVLAYFVFFRNYKWKNFFENQDIPVDKEFSLLNIHK